MLGVTAIAETSISEFSLDDVINIVRSLDYKLNLSSTSDLIVVFLEIEKDVDYGLVLDSDSDLRVKIDESTVYGLILDSDFDPVEGEIDIEVPWEFVATVQQDSLLETEKELDIILHLKSAQDSLLLTERENEYKLKLVQDDDIIIALMENIQYRLKLLTEDEVLKTPRKLHIIRVPDDSTLKMRS